MQHSKSCRSVLFVTALAVERYAKCRAADSDISLVDLEDSVSPRKKKDARELAERFFPRERDAGTRLAIRINSLCAHHGLTDLLAIRDYANKPDQVWIPKVESARDIEIAESVLIDRCPDIEFAAIVETARGLQRVEDIVGAGPRLKAVVFGSADFASSIHSTRDWDPLYWARARLVVAARAAGLHVIDTASFDINDIPYLEREARKARDMGFSGKAAIHPRQVAVINDVFSPDEAALTHARKIVAQSQQNQDNIAVVDGMMVGAPIVEAARRLLEEFEANARVETPKTSIPEKTKVP